ncbi:MAG: tetraacyldisaccharide 4'-kinase [Candidatus Omnitrophica bacterium]|nr:tetraacyldisaccharide 4'-kinase [Candidatus Omnitrophota bacterium]
MKEYIRFVIEGRRKTALAAVIRLLLFPLSVLYGLAQAVAKWIDSLVRKELPLTVVSVGNLTWGGTGKTPLVETIAKKLTECGKRVLILRRGYGEDETRFLSEHLPESRVAVGKDRYRTAMEALKKEKFDIALLDDGFQQWALKRDFDIVTVNALNPFGSYSLLPAGILREPPSALKRSSAVVITNSDQVSRGELDELKAEISRYTRPSAEVFASSIVPDDFIRGGGAKKLSLEALRGKKVVAYTAIGNPESFWRILEKLGLNVVSSFEYRDHHRLTKDELSLIKEEKEKLKADEIVTTEKDFTRQPAEIITVFDPVVLRVKLGLQDGEKFFSLLFRVLCR